METGDDMLSGNKTVWPGSIPYVFHRAGAYGMLLVATYEQMIAGSLSACNWLTHVTRGTWRVAPPIDGGGGGLADVS